MSDKMLMENWLKFLTESPRYMDDYGDGNPVPTGPDSYPIIDTSQYSYPNASGCVTVGNIIKSIKLSQQSYEISDIHDERMAHVTKIAKEAGMDVALAIAIASAGVATGGTAAVLGLIPSAFRIAKTYFLGEPPESTVKGIEAFVDHINIAQPYQDIFNKHDLRKIDDEYIKYLAKEHPNDCIEKVMDINKFIQEHYELCKDSYPSTKPIDVARREMLPGEGGRDYGKNPLTPEEQAEEDKEIAAYKAARRESKESKFHDNWRDFLLTEEKL